MTQIKNVALAGATGNLGTQILKALLEKGFKVTALTRNASSASLPAEVEVKEVDHSSVDSLTSALAGQDVLINASNVHEPSSALRMVDAAIAAGVKRFIPSDFGMDPNNPLVAALPVFGVKAATYKHLKEKTAQGGSFTYTIVSNGPFFDGNIKSKFLGLDLDARKADLYDGGENVMPTTTLASIGQATAEVLKHLDETANRVVYIADVYISQKRQAELAEEALGGKFEFVDVDITSRFNRGMEDIKAGNISYAAIGANIQYAISKSDYCKPWERDDSALLGVKKMSDDEVRKVIKDLAG